MKKHQLIAIANENIEIVRAGEYNVGSFTYNVDESITTSYPATHIFNKTEQHKHKGLVNVVSATTLEAAKAFAGSVTVLNFASARSPGGGHLKGSMAQEEYLCYRSTLYTALNNQAEHYAKSRANLHNGLYNGDALYTKSVVVIRDDEYRISEPWKYDCITLAAVNAGTARSHGVSDEEIDTTMRQRCQRVIEIAIKQGTCNLILGAFGCGVFKNDAAKVAGYFYDSLTANKNALYFDNVIFAIPGKDYNFHKFAERFDLFSTKEF